MSQTPATLDYFGTDLAHAGHGFLKLQGNSILPSKVNFNSIPFNPEQIVGTHSPKGEVTFCKVADYAVCAIVGSCRDSRPGSKSVFWVKADIAPESLKEIILSMPIAKRIIEQMPFQVQW